MKKSQLRELVLEAMKGYSKYAPGGTTSGGTTADFATILKNVALGKDQVTRGNDTLDKANPDNVAKISRGEKPIYEGDAKLYSKEEAIDYIENNPPVKYYRIGVSKGTSQTLQDAEKAIEVVKQSPINQFELSAQENVIAFNAPFDQKHADLVRSMGSLD